MNAIKVFLKVNLSINQSIEKYDVDSNEFDRDVVLCFLTIVFVAKSIDLK